jgi:gas vesicle protein
MKWLRNVLMMVTMLIAAAGVVGCESKNGKGPAEQAGKAIDDAMEKADDKLKEVAEDTKDAVKDAAEDVKEEVKEAVDN